MLIFWKERLVILSVPKTATTSLHAVLRPHAEMLSRRAAKHVTMQQFNRYVRPLVVEMTGKPFRTVAMVREPRAWLGSWWRFRSRGVTRLPENATRDMSFDQFVRDWCSDPVPPHARIRSQAAFLDPGEGPPVDRLFRYEEMAHFLGFLKAELAQDIVLPVTNVSPEGDLTLAPDTAALLAEKAAADFHIHQTLTMPD